MSKAAMGACIKYCGHEAVFDGDIWHFNGVNVVVANGPIDKQLDRSKEAVEWATHELTDFPKAGYWGTTRGIFVVPEDQVTELKRVIKKSNRRNG